jgi:hypothetical protein
MTLSITVTQLNNGLPYAECPYAECHILDLDLNLGLKQNDFAEKFNNSYQSKWKSPFFNP